MIQRLSDLKPDSPVETVAQFGNGAELTAILTQPNGREQDGPIAIFLNAGIVHRIGPFRLHVDLARELARRGVTSLRMDLSGLGDSSVRKSLRDGECRAVLDVRDAMDYLSQQFGEKRFVLIGLCSGAFNAHQSALVEDRVVGAVFLDGIVYKTPGNNRRLLWQKLTGLRFWRNAIKRRLMYRESDVEQQSGERLGEQEFFENNVTAQQTASEIQSMVDRDLQLLFVYTEGYDDISGRRQFYEMFGIRPNEQVQVEYMKNCVHTFRLTQNRNRLVERVADWWQDRFPSTDCL